MMLTLRSERLGGIFLVAVMAAHLANAQTIDLPATRPNVVLIMVDDLGYSDIGAFGAEIETPHLDQLATDGIQFTSFYNTGRCWPTRGSLLTGYYPHQIRRDIVPGVPSGGRGKRPSWAWLLPRYLHDAGYKSYHSGKWHIDGMPLKEGFDRSYYLRDQGRFFYPKVHYLDDEALPPVRPGSGYYGTTAIADRAIEFLDQHQQEHSGQPFFHYIAFTAPHFPLHALPEDVAKYDGVYDVGWEAIRLERFERQRKRGIVRSALSDVEYDVGPPYHFPDALEKLGEGEVNRPAPWRDLTENQQRFQATKMTLHAAMIDRVDQEIGRIVGKLKQMDAWDNTLILFLSDNGASAEIMVRTDGHDPVARPGSGASYLCLGPGWSTVSNTPFRRHKTWVHEGGTSTPLIAHWPRGIPKPGICRTPGHVVDIVPTVLDVCRVRMQRSATAHPEDVVAWEGQSLRDCFDMPGDQARLRTLWWEHEGNRALRDGHLKAVAAKGEPWALYDLRLDRAEQKDLSVDQPKELQRLTKLWQQMYDRFCETARTSQ